MGLRHTVAIERKAETERGRERGREKERWYPLCFGPRGRANLCVNCLGIRNPIERTR